jgi:glucose uptake protein
MMGLLYALITVLAWGTWLAPSQNIPFRNQQTRTFYVALMNLVLASLVTLGQGFDQLTLAVFWLPFLGGVIWAISGFCAFTATHHLGMAKAFGIWAPLNILISLVWGIAWFGELVGSGPRQLALLAGSLALILIGMPMIIFAKGAPAEAKRNVRVGLAGALGAGVLWGTYFVPVKMSEASLWVAAFPLACGIFVGSVALVVIARAPLRLDRSTDYLRTCATGVLWTIGNYGMLLLVQHMGAGKGYTIAQLSVVVNALNGIYLFKDPPPGTRAAWLMLGGCLLATAGGIILGNLK